MKVSDLITHLEQLPPDDEVILSIDEEGNGYQSLADAELGYAEKSYNNQWEVWHPDDVTDNAYEAEENYDKKLLTELEQVVILWP